MSKFLDEFVVECENRVKTYDVDSSDESLFTLEEDLKNKAKEKLNKQDIPRDYIYSVFNELVKIIDCVVSKKVGLSILHGAKNFKSYVDQLQEKYDVRWSIERVSDVYTLKLEFNAGFWVEATLVGKIFNSVNDVESYINETKQKTGVTLPVNKLM